MADHYFTCLQCRNVFSIEEHINDQLLVQCPHCGEIMRYEQGDLYVASASEIEDKVYLRGTEQVGPGDDHLEQTVISHSGHDNSDRASEFASLGKVCILRIENGPSAGETIVLPFGTTTIGRKDADHVLEDAQISRKHIAIDMMGGRAMLRDLASSNGTTVNGSPVHNVQLKEHDQIMLGNTLLVVEYIGPAQNAP